MTVADQITRLTPYASRLLEDDYLQEQISETVSHLRKGSRAAKRKGARRAVADRRVLQQLAAAATATTEVVRVLAQPARPKRHPLRRIALLAVAAGGAAFAYREQMGGPRHG